MKRTTILLVLASMLALGCRNTDDGFLYIGESPELAYDSYSTQFEFIWKTMSTGYSLWDRDTVSWDDRYDRLMPKFKALDARIAADDTVSLKMLGTLYKQLFSGLLDHHLYVRIYNLYPTPSEKAKDFIEIKPGDDEVFGRDYIERGTTCNSMLEEIRNYLDNGQFESDFEIRDHLTCKEENENLLHVCKIVLPDGRTIPYMWQANALLYEFFYKKKSDLYPHRNIPESWFKAIAETPRDSLAGIILDNRSNHGGYTNDIDYLIGPYIDEPVIVEYNRFKAGPGRLDYTCWFESKVYPEQKYRRDLTSENIPLVVLCDAGSVSMGEFETFSMKRDIPTCHTIGERTYGATCALMPDMVDYLYTGPYGTEDYGHFVYTVSMQCKFPQYGFLEGVGYTPDQIILHKDCSSPKDHIQAAIDYISGYNTVQ